ncbi:MAG: HlyD family efflux transporter periplasmic adaptor subunit [Candidatus Thiodiazotropha sp.]|jgi:membrane fusion protein
MNGELFRREVVAAQQSNRHTGEILLTQSIPLWHLTTIVIIILLIIILFLSFGEFTRKERVFGLTVPGHGAIPLISRESGIIFASKVSEGSFVEAGDLLFEIRRDKFSDLGETQRLIEESLSNQTKNIENEISNRNNQAEEETSNLKKRARLLKQEIKSLDTEIALQSQHIAAAKSLLDNMKPLFEEKIIPELQYQQQVSSYIEQQARLENLKRELISIKSRHLDTLNEIRAVKLRTNADQSSLERSLLSTKQQRLEQRSAHISYIRAPVAGTISNIQVDVGRQVEAGSSLATLLPEGVLLDVQIFVPSSAIGFLKTGQHVKLRYDAYPYQKFGVYEGELTELANVDISSMELQSRFPHLMQQHQGMTFFRATVRPESQEIQAYGKPISLRTGLTLQADIHLERKRLIEWIFDPVFALGSKI